MLTYTVPVAGNNPKNEQRDVRNRNQITQAESVPMGQYFIQQFHFVCLISGSLSCSYFYQAVPVFYAHTTKENHPLKLFPSTLLEGFVFLAKWLIMSRLSSLGQWCVCGGGLSRVWIMPTEKGHL